jgi:hypothetical protein
MPHKLYILKLNPEFNQEYFDCTFRNGVTGPVAQRTKDRLEQAYGAALRWEEWTPPVAEAPAPKKGRSKAAPKKVVVKVAGEPTVSRPSARFTTPKKPEPAEEKSPPPTRDDTED